VISSRPAVPAIVAALLLVPLAGGRPAAQAPRAMTLVDLVALDRLVEPQLSPDGTMVAYQLNMTNWKANRRVPHLWVQPTAGGPAVQLTSGDVPDTTPRWSPDSRTILFIRAGQLATVPAAGGDVTVVSKHAANVSSPAWAPDGATAYFLSIDPRSAEQAKREELRDDVFALDEDYRQRHLWRIAIATGAETKITSGDWSVVSYRLSRDGGRIVMGRAPTPLADDSGHGELWMANADGSGAVQLTHNGIEEVDPAISPDGREVLFLATANERLEPYYSGGLFVMPSEGGPPRRLMPGFPYDVQRAAWAPEGRTIFLAANMGVHSELFRLDPGAAAPAQLTDGRHSIPAQPAPSVWSLVPAAGRMVVQFDEPTRYGDVYTMALTPGAQPRRVTRVYDTLVRDFRLPRQEQIDWKAPDGTTIEGLLFYPLDYEPGRRYPLVVQLHGGPAESDAFGFWGWMDYIQVLTARGWMVMRPNYRGSAGYGDAFLRDMVGGYFTHAHLDVLAGVDALVARGLADGDRLAVMGHSAGGHLVNKLITVTDRFKAAASAAGAANWISMYAQTDTRVDRDLWFGGTPWQKDAPFSVYWDQSPLKDAWRVTTPTIFLYGENDARVPMQQGLEMFRALKANGVPTHLYVAPRDQHQWTELRHQLFKGNVELEWFERHVRGQSYAWESAPGDGQP
jgi:dipeptidyl aminopeptidase/acylaminoacyl peptidase